MVSPEDQSRLLIAVILVIVWLASALKVQVIIAAFLAGIALANMRLERRVLQNIDFLSSGIFIPIFFLMVGVEATEEGDAYVGLILLKDILPDLPVKITV